MNISIYSKLRRLALIASPAILLGACQEIESESANPDALERGGYGQGKQHCSPDSGICIQSKKEAFARACRLKLHVERRDDLPAEDDFPKSNGLPTEDWRDFEALPNFAWDTLGGESEIRRIFHEISLDVCKSLYQNPRELRINRFKPVVLSFQPNRHSIAWTVERSHEYRIVVSTLKKHVKHYAHDKKSDLKGILTHQISRIFQYADRDGDRRSHYLPEEQRLIDRAQRARMLSGMADYVRTQSGWVRDFSERNEARELGEWADPKVILNADNQKSVVSQGPEYQALGWFFTWLEHRKPGSAHRLNQSLSSYDGHAWSFDDFARDSVLGESAPVLWERYRNWARQPSCHACGPDQYCETLIPEKCGENNLGMARCVDKADFCPAVIEPVCGCDDKTYNNACEASRAGVSLKDRTDCESSAQGLRPPY